jgi:hypothetical protein
MNDGNTKTIFSNGSYSNIIPNLIIKIIKPRDKSYLSVRIDHIWKTFCGNNQIKKDAVI